MLVAPRGLPRRDKLKIFARVTHLDADMLSIPIGGIEFLPNVAIGS